MKKLIQIFLFLIIIIIFAIFYDKYFKNQKTTNKENIPDLEKQILDNKSNYIKNLRYDLSLRNDSKYMIVADESELSYKGDVELVNMTSVTAKFIDKNNFELVINADKAVFNSATYNTNFQQNVTIRYKDDAIFSENLDLDFTKNIVKIYNNVVYEVLNGIMSADNVKINLITKNMEIFMNNLSNKIIGVIKSN